MMTALRGLPAAFGFLTRLPVGGFPFSPDELRWSSAHFPLVGAVLGAALAAVMMLSARAGTVVAATLAVSAGMLLTGAFHEDGLADTADALGGATDRDKLFVILRDSRIGSFGAAALCMALFFASPSSPRSPAPRRWRWCSRNRSPGFRRCG